MEPRSFSINKRSLAQDLLLLNSPGSYNLPKTAVIIMDGLKDPSMELLDWVLNITSDGTWSVALLEVMPWLNIPLSCKKWSEDVMIDIQNLCRYHGIIPEVITLMGHPLRSLVVERIASLHPILVVIDRYYYEPHSQAACNIVAMNDHREYDMIKAQPHINTEDYSFTGESPVPTPELIINSGQCMRILKPKLSAIFTKEKKMHVGCSNHLSHFGRNKQR